jgi:hypothetical protein
VRLSENDSLIDSTDLAEDVCIFNNKFDYSDVVSLNEHYEETSGDIIICPPDGLRNKSRAYEKDHFPTS